MTGKGFNIEDFVECPSVALLSDLKKNEWFSIAERYGIEVKRYWKKDVLKATIIQALVEDEIVDESALDLCEVGDLNSNRSFELEKLKTEMKMLELQYKEKEREREHELKILEKKSELSVNVEESDKFAAYKYVRLVPDFDESDPDEFFIQFEKLCVSYDWPKSKWIALIQSKFVGKGKSSYNAIEAPSHSDYDYVKRTVLNAYELTAEYYKVKLRSLVKESNVTYTEFSYTVSKFANRWIKACDISTFNELKELLILEQFLNSIDPKIKQYLLERDVTDLKNASKLAENYSLMTKDSLPAKKSDSKMASTQNVGGSKNHSSKESLGKVSESPSRVKKCFLCKKVGHVVANCFHNPKRKKDDESKKGSVALTRYRTTKEEKDFVAVDGDSSLAYFQSSGSISLSEHEVGVPIRILRDTGASKSIVLRKAVPFIENMLIDEHVVLQGIGKLPIVLPLARVYLRSGFVNAYVEVAVKDELPVENVSFILGNDIAGKVVVPDPIVSFNPAMVVTRSQSSKVQNAGEGSTKSESDDLVSDVGTRENELSRRLGTSVDTDNCQFNSKQDSSMLDFSSLPINRVTLVAAQKEDPSLSKFRDSALTEGESEGERCCYYLEDDLLLRKYRSPLAQAGEIADNEVHQVVIPACYRTKVIRLAHDHLGGHLGVRKTIKRLQQHFYWVGMHRDVSRYCKSCHTCQVVGKPNQKIPPAPLQPIPVVGEPFSRVIVDCVGPLPKTKKGSQYILTYMCASTRFPEAIPIKDIKATTIIPVLERIFMQYGVPKALQSDQGTNFVSTLFQQVMEQLGIQQYIATAYHPQSQGALERLHQTLKSMLRKYCFDNEQDWDNGLIYVLYALRSTPQESLGFSPFQLLFGRDVRGPLQVLKETWVQDQEKSVSFNKYMSILQKRLKTAHDLSQQFMRKSQEKMKFHYDEKAKVRNFKSGDLVMLFLSANKSPLEPRYEGPFQVISREGETTYIIATPGKRRSQKMVHVNLLKEYHPREDMPKQLTLSVSSEESDDFPVKMKEVRLDNSAVMKNIESKLTHLNEYQIEDIRKILDSYPDVCGDVPKICSGVQHDVELLVGSKPIKQRPYRTSPEKTKILKEEVQFLLDNNLAEPSGSPWASPCLLVKKSGGGYRMCTDFRRVNSATVIDSYPLPRTDDIIDAVGISSFVTKLDLMKGYYQVPLTTTAKKISAFVTPFGLFQYCVLPFGMVNAPPTFQRLMDKIIEGLHNVRVYIDDLIIFNSSWESHIKTLHSLFDRLNQFDLTVNLAKSEFGKAQLSYLGHMVGGGCVAPLTSKVDDILQMPEPQTKKQVQRFLGMTGYYRNFCPNYAQVAAPLTALTSSKTTFSWTKECQRAYEQLKKLLMAAPVLHVPDFSRPFMLHVDASDVGVGGVLLQSADDGVAHPVSYFSKKLKPYQKHYSTIEKEALALLSAIEKFEIYLDGAKTFTVYSDHNPLQFVMRMKNKNPRLTRWALALQPYNIIIKHIQGKDNVLADFLSRAPM